MDANGVTIPVGVHLRPLREGSWYHTAFDHAHRLIHQGPALAGRDPRRPEVGEPGARARGPDQKEMAMKSFVIGLCVLILTGLAASPAQAEEWIQMGDSASGSTYVDADTVRVMPEGYVEYRCKSVRVPEIEGPGGEMIAEHLYTVLYDHAANLSTVSVIRTSRRDGSVIVEGEVPAGDRKWTNSPPGSVRAACNDFARRMAGL